MYTREGADDRVVLVGSIMPLDQMSVTGGEGLHV